MKEKPPVPPIEINGRNPCDAGMRKTEIAFTIALFAIAFYLMIFQHDFLFSCK